MIIIPLQFGHITQFLSVSRALFPTFSGAFSYGLWRGLGAAVKHAIFTQSTMIGHISAIVRKPVFHIRNSVLNWWFDGKLKVGFGRTINSRSLFRAMGFADLGLNLITSSDLDNMLLGFIPGFGFLEAGIALLNALANLDILHARFIW